MSSSRTLSYPHLAWVAGHALVVLGSLVEFGYLLAWKSSPRAHKVALAGAILSWGIVVQKGVGYPSLQRSYWTKAAVDENAQYMFLALFWWFQKPIALTIVPYATFSIFQILTFIRGTFLPKKSATKDGKTPATPPPTGFPAQLSKSIQTLLKKHYEHAMLFVSFVEISIMVRLVFGALLFKNSFLAPMFYAIFLRFRYYLSPATRKAFNYCSKEIDSYTNHPNCPAAVKRGVETLKGIILRFAESAVLPIPTNPQQPTSTASSTTNASTGTSGSNSQPRPR